MTQEHPAITALLERRGFSWPPEKIEAHPALYRQVRSMLIFDPEATDGVLQALRPQYKVTKPIEMESWAAKDERISHGGK